jgi:proteasome accessory factor C
MRPNAAGFTRRVPFRIPNRGSVVMKHWERLIELHKLLLARRTPVPRQLLEQHLDCSRATVSRAIGELRDWFGAPIEYSADHNGYRYRRDGDQAIEVPGLWFTAEELRALLVLQKVLANAEPRLFDDLLAPLRERLDRLLTHPQLAGDQLSRRVRILGQGRRETDPLIFERAAAGLLQRRRLDLRYAGRRTAEQTARTVSPQRLVHYRDNWYLDAWCHRREALRLFALDRIETLTLSDEPAEEIPDDILDDYFATGYGIFAGPPRHIAVLRFTPERARWVAEESWFPGQRGEFREDGSYLLRLPYSESPELVMDILKYGPDVEVLEPAELREEVRERLRRALRRYEAEEGRGADSGFEVPM